MSLLSSRVGVTRSWPAAVVGSGVADGWYVAAEDVIEVGPLPLAQSVACRTSIEVLPDGTIIHRTSSLAGWGLNIPIDVVRVKSRYLRSDYFSRSIYREGHRRIHEEIEVIFVIPGDNFLSYLTSGYLEHLVRVGCKGDLLDNVRLFNATA